MTLYYKLQFDLLSTQSKKKNNNKGKVITGRFHNQLVTSRFARKVARVDM